MADWCCRPHRPACGIGVVNPGDPAGMNAYALADVAVGGARVLVAIAYLLVGAAHSRPDKTDAGDDADCRQDIACPHKRTFCLVEGGG